MTAPYKRPTGYVYDGEPRFILGANGVTIEFKGGQPVMDAGLENSVLFSLHTLPGWWGNYVIGQEHKIGESDYDKLATQSITRTALLNGEKDARKALNWLISSGLATSIDVEITNYAGFGVKSAIDIHRGTGNDFSLLFLTNGANWVRQMEDPASGRLTEDGN